MNNELLVAGGSGDSYQDVNLNNISIFIGNASPPLLLLSRNEFNCFASCSQFAYTFRTLYCCTHTYDLRIMSCYDCDRCTFMVPTAGTWFGAICSLLALLWVVIVAHWPACLGLSCHPLSSLLNTIHNNTNTKLELVTKWTEGEPERRRAFEAKIDEVISLMTAADPLGTGLAQTVPNLLVSTNEAAERRHREMLEKMDLIADSLASIKSNPRSRRLTTLSRRKVRPRRRPDVGMDTGNAQSIPGV